jgi:deoxyribodipyrimidine photo-lyase
MRTAVVLLTRDLRVHDNPALAAACANAERVVPLYVLDPHLRTISANRIRFLHQALADLRTTLRGKGGDLVIRHGEPVAETIKIAQEVEADGVALAADVSRYARRRERRLVNECQKHRLALRLFPGVTVVDPGQLRPGGADHYRVFSPYFRAWEAATWRTEFATPRVVRLPSRVRVGDVPPAAAGDSPDAVPGGETDGLRRLKAWMRHVGAYDEVHNDLPADTTSRLSPYLRFGCV